MGGEAVFRRSGWSARIRRIAHWLIAAVMFAAPWLAMQFTTEVNWTAGDFFIFAAMLATASVAFEFTIQASSSRRVRTTVGIFLSIAFFMLWLDLAVGISASN